MKIVFNSLACVFAAIAAVETVDAVKRMEFNKEKLALYPICAIGYLKSRELALEDI